MTTLIFDMEADNLYDSFKTGTYQTVTQVWCIATIDIETDVRQEFSSDSGDLVRGLDYLASAEVLLGHNIIEYDFRVFKKLYDWQYHGKVIDTLVLSRYLYPERVGGHSIESWGKRVNRHKPAHEDWSKFSPEMLVRCQEDTEINLKAYGILVEEAKARGQTIEGVKLW